MGPAFPLGLFLYHIHSHCSYYYHSRHCSCLQGSHSRCYHSCSLQLHHSFCCSGVLGWGGWLIAFGDLWYHHLLASLIYLGCLCLALCLFPASVQPSGTRVHQPCPQSLLRALILLLAQLAAFRCHSWRPLTPSSLKKR